MAKPKEIDGADAETLAWLRREYEEPFEGWDFSYLDGRRVFCGEPTWDFSGLVVEAMQKGTSLLEVDTGGGERLAGLLKRSGFTGRACATEGYPPNVSVARKRLEPLGVEVYDIADPRVLPFDDGAFDLVVNRHGAFSLAEEFRLLRPGGVFIMQQVGNEANRDMLELFGKSQPPPSPLGCLQASRGAAEEAGFDVVHAGEAYPVTCYRDVGALVYYLKCVPWTLADFSVEAYADTLLALHRRIVRGETVNIGFHYFMLALQKPGEGGLLVP